MGLNWRQEGNKGQWHGHCGPWDFWIYKFAEGYKTTYHFGHEVGDIDYLIKVDDTLVDIQGLCRTYALSRTIRLLSDLENTGLR